MKTNYFKVLRCNGTMNIGTGKHMMPGCISLAYDGLNVPVTISTPTGDKVIGKAHLYVYHDGVDACFDIDDTHFLQHAMELYRATPAVKGAVIKRDQINNMMVIEASIAQIELSHQGNSDPWILPFFRMVGVADQKTIVAAAQQLTARTAVIGGSGGGGGAGGGVLNVIKNPAAGPRSGYADAGMALTQTINQDTCKHEPVEMIFSSFCKKCNKTL